MSRSEALPRELSLYRQAWVTAGRPGADTQPEIVGRFEELLAREPRCFERDCWAAHMTGSAVIVTRDLKQVLLTHHRKLNMWLQLGGHADGDKELAQVAAREGQEESGLNDLELFPQSRFLGLEPGQDPFPLDLDIHKIPARGAEPVHWHYDARYLLWTSSPEAIQASEESHALKWFAVDEAYAIVDPWSMPRLFDKVKYLREHLS